MNKTTFSKPVLYFLEIPVNVNFQEIQWMLEIFSDEEKEKATRKVFEKDRILQTIATFFLRTKLGEILNTAPETIQFKKNHYGKPSIQGFPIHFNLSHAGSFVVLVVHDEEIGVDVEYHRNGDILDIADSFFTRSEMKELYQFEGKEKEKRFFQFWTAKESVIKAVGEGLSLELDSFSVSFLTEPPSLTGHKKNYNHWNLQHCTPQKDVYLTLCSKSTSPFRLHTVSLVTLFPQHR